MWVDEGRKPGGEVAFAIIARGAGDVVQGDCAERLGRRSLPFLLRSSCIRRSKGLMVVEVFSRDVVIAAAGVVVALAYGGVAGMIVVIYVELRVSVAIYHILQPLLCDGFSVCFFGHFDNVVAEVAKLGFGDVCIAHLRGKIASLDFDFFSIEVSREDVDVGLGILSHHSVAEVDKYFVLADFLVCFSGQSLCKCYHNSIRFSKITKVKKVGNFLQISSLNSNLMKIGCN